jgi:anaerobic magnesium-protoporphyrin IX monomethyl ester cyclase
MDKKRVLLSASYSIIEPLGIMHLAAIAKQEGWEPNIIIGNEPDFQAVRDSIKEFKPSLLGFTAYTGNHVHAFNFFDELRSNGSGLEIVVGGPHPTAFPEHAVKHADYVVPSEGFNSFRRILRGEAEKGVVALQKLEEFPIPDRDSFYKNSPTHLKNPIKSIITQTGCPYRCTYCYNSQNVDSIADALAPEDAKKMKAVLKGSSGRLFPKNVRSVDSVMEEVEDIQRIDPDTRMIFFQDDIFGVEINWLREFRKKYNARIPFHIMTRFEFFDPSRPQGKERAELMRESGCTGLTFAIESSDHVLRKEVLDRKMEKDMMYRSLAHAAEYGLTARTFSMVGLPYGATSSRTKMGTEADLDTLEFNVKLKEETGLPTIAWASILVPYPKTSIDPYCTKHGFYRGDYSDIIQGSYRQDSVLHFAREWVGPELRAETPGVWMDPNEEEHYKQKLSQLMYYFPAFASQPKGHIMARKFLETDNLTPEGFNNAFRAHSYDHELFMVADPSDPINSVSAETHLGRLNPMIHGNKESEDYKDNGKGVGLSILQNQHAGDNC